jgi:rhamnogalacturonyl hydrolase YesR
MSKKGWHKARLLDATGTPFNPDNNPKDKFERDAIEALISGKSYFERVEKIGDKDYLRAATSVSAVMVGCISCHPDRKIGDLLGAISYSILLK